tara:strand:- start:102 stop:239 length:138 start_codon:yes stop_codon:yes gene_type:complete
MDIEKAEEIIANYNKKDKHTIKEKRDFIAATKVKQKHMMQKALGM